MNECTHPLFILSLQSDGTWCHRCEAYVPIIVEVPYGLRIVEPQHPVGGAEDLVLRHPFINPGVATVEPETGCKECHLPYLNDVHRGWSMDRPHTFIPQFGGALCLHCDHPQTDAVHSVDTGGTDEERRTGVFNDRSDVGIDIRSSDPATDVPAAYLEAQQLLKDLGKQRLKSVSGGHLECRYCGIPIRIGVYHHTNCLGTRIEKLLEVMDA